jgi:hypothetical protein
MARFKRYFQLNHACALSCFPFHDRSLNAFLLIEFVKPNLNDALAGWLHTTCVRRREGRAPGNCKVPCSGLPRATQLRSNGVSMLLIHGVLLSTQFSESLIDVRLFLLHKKNLQTMCRHTISRAEFLESSPFAKSCGNGSH